MWTLQRISKFGTRGKYSHFVVILSLSLYTILYWCSLHSSPSKPKLNDKLWPKWKETLWLCIQTIDLFCVSQWMDYVEWIFCCCEWDLHRVKLFLRLNFQDIIRTFGICAVWAATRILQLLIKIGSDHWMNCECFVFAPVNCESECLIIIAKFLRNADFSKMFNVFCRYQIQLTRISLSTKV